MKSCIGPIVKQIWTVSKNLVFHKCYSLPVEPILPTKELHGSAVKENGKTFVGDFCILAPLYILLYDKGLVQINMV